MAAGKAKAYDFAKKYIGDGTIDLDDTTNWKVALYLSTSNANSLSIGTGILADLTNEHANAFGYTTGGVALSGIVWTRSGSTLTFDASDLAPAWTAAGGDIVSRNLVIYKNATVNTIVKPLLCTVLLNLTPADVTVIDGNPMNITWNASGILTLSGAAVD